MKTGGYKKTPEPFHVSFLAIDGLLKRISFKDAAYFKEHNPIYIFDSNLFGDAICFNLFSEYGVGNKLKPLLNELLKNKRIEPDLNNIFFREIVELAPQVNKALLDGDDFQKTIWGYKYAIASLNKTDEISRERLKRLLPLFEDTENIKYDKESNTIDVQEICSCKFCQEFRRFPKGDNKVEDIIKLIIREMIKENYNS